MCMGKNTIAQKSKGWKVCWEERRSSEEGLPWKINKQEDGKQTLEKKEKDKEQMVLNT